MSDEYRKRYEEDGYKIIDLDKRLDKNGKPIPPDILLQSLQGKVNENEN